jgi:glycine/D-amino acid oxidase-like deaminating enzyme
VHLPPTPSPPWRRHTEATYAPLEDDREVDVVVVGAGIVGLTAAALLVRAGRSVTVLEALTVGAGTSGRTTAKASALQGLRYQQLEERHGLDAAARYARAQVDGLEWMARQVERSKADCDWERRPAITYATTGPGARSVAQELDAAQRAGLPVEAVGAGLPFEDTGAVALADQAQLDPGPYLAALAHEVDQSPGGWVHEGSRVTAVHGVRRHRVLTEHAAVSARHVIVATLLPILDRGLLFARAKPQSSYLVALEATGVVPDGMYLSADAPTRSVRSARHGGATLLIVGGEGHDTGRGSPTMPRYDELARWASRQFDVGEVVHRWSAHDYRSADDLPLVGSASPLTPGVLVATGLQKWGMTMGTAAALSLVDRVLGATDGPSAPWASLFAPARLAPRSIVDLAKINGAVAGRMTSDWVRPGSELDEQGRPTRRRAGVVPVANDDDGRPSVVCTHLGGVCSWNDGDRTWDCPLHGSRFEEDGTVLAGPATSPLHRRPRRETTTAAGATR